MPQPDAAQPTATHPPAWLVGRERSWSHLQARLTSALRGAGGLVAVSGEAGIGKTALVEALLGAARQAGALVLAGGCYDLTITPPYGPWNEALAGYQAVAGLPQLPPALRDPSSAAVASSQAFHERARAFLSEIAARIPLVLLLEDVHWADAASLELLRAVGRRLDGIPLLLVVTWRDDEATRAQPLYRLLPALLRETHCTRVELPRLQPADMLAFVATRYALPEPDRSALAEWTQRHAEGNPFFAGEVLLALEHSGALRMDGSRWRFSPPALFSVPPLVRQTIEERLAQLSADTQRQLEYAAILGPEASLELVQAAAGVTDETLAAALEQAVAARIIGAPTEDMGALRFQHALVRETLYERQPLLRRRARHRRVAELLLAGRAPAPAALGYHFQAAHDPRAVTWLARAGERSLALHAHDDAIAHVTRALELATHFGSAVPADALRARGRAWELAGDFARARADYETCLQTAREAGDRHAEWQALLDLGALWAERDYGRADAALQAALRLARSELDDAAVAQSLNAVGNWQANHEETAQALASHTDALAIFTRLGDQHGVAATHDLVAVSHYIAGDMRRAAREYERAVELLVALDDRQRLASALATWATTGGNWETDATVAMEGPFEDWLRANERARALATDIGWLAGQSYAEIQAGAILGPRGRAGAALALAESGMALAERIGHRQWIVSGHVSLGRIHAELLETEPAREHLEAALAQARAIGSLYWVAMAAAGLGALLVEAGDLDAAAAVLETVVDVSQPAASLSQRRGRLAWIQLQLARGEPERALCAIEQLYTSASNASDYSAIPWLALARGDACAALGRDADADNAYEDARRGALRLEYRQLLWRVDAAHARSLQRAGRIAEARAASERALATSQEIAATLATPAQRAAFQRGVQRRLPGTAAGRAQPLPGGLSPRELEVLRLVAQGCTDVDVGARLCISHRTVGRHLQSVYNKLGVGSRAAAVAFAYEQRLLAEPPDD